jgi:glucose-1-phosphate thymidylyltransferase
MELRGVIVVQDGSRAEGGGPGQSLPAIEQVANRPIAHHVLEALAAAGVQEVIVASSARCAEAVRACLEPCQGNGAGRIRFVAQMAPLGFMSALRLVAPLVGDSACIVHSAGGLLTEPLAPLADGLTDRPDALLTVHHAHTTDQRLSAGARRALRLVELDRDPSGLALAEVLAFGPAALRRAMGAAQLPGETGHARGVHAGELAAMVEGITLGGGSVQVRRADTWRAYRGDAADLLELNRIVLDRIESAVPHDGTGSNRIEGRVNIDERADVRDSVVVGPVVIGPGARVRDAYIGPYTAIGARARVEGAEVERSIISPGASIMHIGGRITASVVGPDARVFRDFSLPRAVRLRVGAGTEIALC